MCDLISELFAKVRLILGQNCHNIIAITPLEMENGKTRPPSPAFLSRYLGRPISPCDTHQSPSAFLTIQLCANATLLAFTHVPSPAQ